MQLERIEFTINGERRALAVDPACRALDVLREDLGLTGTKDGCGVGECGACTIVADDLAMNACLTPAMQLNGTDVLTAEGLVNTRAGAALQDAFLACGAVQCGFCTPGMLLSSYALLIHNPSPDEAAVRRALSGNLCRCTGYQPIVDAVLRAAEKLKE